MQESMEFTDLLAERRKDCDPLWVSRPMDPLVAHNVPPESNYSRNRAIEAVLASSRVTLVIETLAAARHVDMSVIRREARDMLQEMASKADLATVRWLALFVTKFFKRILLSIRINERYFLGIRSQMRTAQVQYIYVPSHRSYLDFILMSYILFSYDMALPNIASGLDFYRMRIVGELLRKTGAFYMRRSFSSDHLYKEVFRAYIASLVAHNDRAIEFFIEGTRSRSQKSIAPKYGLLVMILESLFRSEVFDIRFVPVSINYDRPLEELLFAYELLGVPKPKESTTGLFQSLSILRKSFSHGHVYVKIASPISAREFLDSAIRRKSTLSPHSKLPSTVVKGLAYAIIDSHKKHTLLTPFNLIALLYNERVHAYPGRPYTLDTLLEDYCWLKKLLCRSFDAIVHPEIKSTREMVSRENERDEILESLSTHKELLAFDFATELKLKERHREINSHERRNTKGHILSERTMRLAVPVINITIYVNPTLAFLTEPAIIALSLERNGISKERAFDRYTLLRMLLSTEFAISSEVNDSVIATEWNEKLSLLSLENCICNANDLLVIGSNIKLFSLLRNLLLPYLTAIYITCTTLLQWDDRTMGDPVEKQILEESQKQAEKLLFDEEGFVSHPYTLSIDLYSSTLISLINYGVVVLSEKTSSYKADKLRLSTLVTDLEKILVQRTPGSYLNLVTLLVPQTSTIPQAKL